MPTRRKATHIVISTEARNAERRDLLLLTFASRTSTARKRDPASYIIGLTAFNPSNHPSS